MWVPGAEGGRRGGFVLQVKVLVLQDGKCSGGGQWRWLHGDVKVPSATEQHT